MSQKATAKKVLYFSIMLVTNYTRIKSSSFYCNILKAFQLKNNVITIGKGGLGS